MDNNKIICPICKKGSLIKKEVIGIRENICILELECSSKSNNMCLINFFVTEEIFLRLNKDPSVDKKINENFKQDINNILFCESHTQEELSKNKSYHIIII